jgi:hypothetical protein
MCILRDLNMIRIHDKNESKGSGKSRWMKIRN